MPKLTLALLAGGISSEREVSLNSGEQVYDALDKDKYQIRRYDPKTDLARLMADAEEIDAALIILHGPYGEDGTLQGMLDLLDIPYQGSGVLGSALAMDKLASKRMYEKAGIPVPPYLVVDQQTELSAADVVARLGLPLVTKPVVGGSSIGMTIVRSEDQLEKAVDDALAYDNAVLIEAFIEGTELTVGVLGNQDLKPLPVIEIIPNPEHDFFNYTAKYTAGACNEICPARIDEATTAMAQTLGVNAHRALFCEGYSRTDMILSGGEMFVLETNTIPGMTATSLLPQAAQEAGLSFGALLDRLVDLSLEAHSAKKR